MASGDVTETGRRSFPGSETLGSLGTGVTYAFFHCEGKHPLIIQVFMMLTSGLARYSQFPCNILTGIGSGPDDLLTFRAKRLFSICSTVRRNWSHCAVG